jgi:predicted phosphoribosyltransferase
MIIEYKDYHNKEHIFESRIEAGRQLATLISEEKIDILEIIPKGGLPIGCGFLEKYIRKKPLVDILIVKKVHVPWSTEAGMGAVTPNGEVFLNDQIVGGYALEDSNVERQIKKTKARISDIRSSFGITEIIPVKGKTVLVIDDGIASGFSMLAAVSWLKDKGANKILVGTPTAPERSLLDLEPKVENIYCLNIRNSFSFAVANAYKNWYDLSMKEAIDYYNKILAID